MDWYQEEDENYNRLMQLAVSLKERKLTREEALQALVRAGIFDENGHYTLGSVIFQSRLISVPNKKASGITRGFNIHLFFS